MAATDGWISATNLECYPGNQYVFVNNATGFSALPAGCYTGQNLTYFGSMALFWSTTGYDNDFAYIRRVWNSHPEVGRSTPYKYNAYSVRCLRD